VVGPFVGALSIAIMAVDGANPIVTNMYTADPAIRYFHGTHWMYTSHDEETAVFGFDMRDWRAYSSDDNMQTWTDHGSIMGLEDIAWADRDAYAIDVVERNHTYFLYFPVEQSAIGVAISDSPKGPFRDPLGKPLLTNDMDNAPVLTIDPSVLIDSTDGQAYLYFGNDSPWSAIFAAIFTLSPTLLFSALAARSTPRVVKLNENLLELDGPILDCPGIDNFFEAPWIHKHDDLYYLSYAGNGPFSDISYATATHPLGPWEKRGVINSRLFSPSSLTNHHSILDTPNGDGSFFFYHTTELSGGQWYRRSVAAEHLYYETDGSIRPVRRTFQGLSDAVRINVGETGHGPYDSQFWYRDRNWRGIFTQTISTEQTIDLPVSLSENNYTADLFQKQRTGGFLLIWFWPMPLQYDFAVEDGDYRVTLHFAETEFKESGQREFDIYLEDAVHALGFDIFQRAGGPERAVAVRYDVSISDGDLNVRLQPKRGTPTLAGIEISRQRHQ